MTPLTIKNIKKFRKDLKLGKVSIGGWMQLSNSNLAEIISDYKEYNWVAVDMEHGSISSSDLPNLFRALELGNTLPLVRIAEGTLTNCKQALDAGAGGIIVPMIESSNQLETVIDYI